MFGTLGMPELLFILVLALMDFGPKRLPQVGKTLGKGLREFRRATNELRRTVNTEISAMDSEPTRPTPAAVPPRRTAAVLVESDTPAAEQPEAAAEAELPVESETTKRAAPAATGDRAETTDSVDTE